MTKAHTTQVPLYAVVPVWLPGRVPRQERAFRPTSGQVALGMERRSVFNPRKNQSHLSKGGRNHAIKVATDENVPDPTRRSCTVDSQLCLKYCLWANKVAWPGATEAADCQTFQMSHRDLKNGVSWHLAVTPVPQTGCTKPLQPSCGLHFHDAKVCFALQ